MNGCFKSRAVRCRENPYGPLRARTWLIGLCPVRLSTSLLWSKNRRKPVSERRASSTFSCGLYGAHTGLKLFEKMRARMACRGISHTFSSFLTRMGPVNCSGAWCDRCIWVISYGLPTGHRLVRHPNVTLRKRKKTKEREKQFLIA